MISASDISIVLSGGSSNVLPALSLGGDPSNQIVIAGINNLFDDISTAETVVGLIDYRCIYIFNDNITDSFYNVELSLNNNNEEGSIAYLGLSVANDLQEITVSGTPTGGSFALNYDGQIAVPSWSAIPADWALNIENALKAQTILSDVVIVPILNINLTFSVQFGGADGKRNHPLLTVETNNLVGFGSPSIEIVKITEGSPINTIATEIDVDTTPPTNVIFDQQTVSLGTIQPTDGIPVWIMRYTPPGVEAVSNDGFNLQIKGTPLP